MDQGFHGFLHGRSGRGYDLLVVDLDGTEGHLVEALRDDSEGFTEFLNSTEVSVVYQRRNDAMVSQLVLARRPTRSTHSNLR